MKALQAVTDGLLVRAGSLLSATFLGYGIQADQVNLLVPAILVIVGVALDLTVGRVVSRFGH